VKFVRRRVSLEEPFGAIQPRVVAEPDGDDVDGDDDGDDVDDAEDYRYGHAASRVLATTSLAPLRCLRTLAPIEPKGYGVMYVYTYIYIYAHVYVHICAYIHIYIYMQAWHACVLYALFHNRWRPIWSQNRTSSQKHNAQTNR
jgi:hypothetical protein